LGGLGLGSILRPERVRVSRAPTPSTAASSTPMISVTCASSRARMSRPWKHALEDSLESCLRTVSSVRAAARASPAMMVRTANNSQAAIARPWSAAKASDRIGQKLQTGATTCTGQWRRRGGGRGARPRRAVLGRSASPASSAARPGQERDEARRTVPARSAVRRSGATAPRGLATRTTRSCRPQIRAASILMTNDIPSYSRQAAPHLSVAGRKTGRYSPCSTVFAEEQQRFLRAGHSTALIYA
jgi:hypothetical protein